MRRRIVGLLLATVVACHEGGDARTRAIDGVAVVLVGSSEPLPFDPRGSRITIVERQIAQAIGHPIVLELDTALGPDLKASLEESVLASLENVATELVRMEKNAPAAFAVARSITRIRCRYDAVIRETDARLVDDVLEVRSPPRRFPLLDRGLLTRAALDSGNAALMRRWGSVDPGQLGAREQETWFEAMTLTRPGYGYVWISEQRHAVADPGRTSGLRAEHLERILKLADVVPKGSPLDRRVVDHLLTEGTWIRDPHASEANPRVEALYGQWLTRRLPSFDEGQTRKVARAFYEHDRVALAGFDQLAFGLSVYDGWVKDGAPIPPRGGDRGETQRIVLCPTAHRGELETEIHLGCSPFLEAAIHDEAQRARLVARIEQTRDLRLLEQVLLNIGVERARHDGRYASVGDAIALLEALRDPALFHHGFRVLFDDHQRRTEVQSALEEAGYRWWRDAPARRPMALLSLARRRAALHPHYADSQWEIATKELGGPLDGELFARYLGEGAVAVEMVGTMWKILPRAAVRDPLVAKALPALLDRDVATRSMKAAPAVALIRRRLCDEHDAAGLTLLRASLQGWATQHPADAGTVANAIVDASPARCAQRDADTAR